MTDELSRRRRRGSRAREERGFATLLAEGVRWPFQTAFEFPATPPEMPKMVSSRQPKGDLVFRSSKMLRDVRCESKIERNFFSNLDGLPEVLWFHEQSTRIQYRMHDRVRYYYPDAFVALGNGHVFVAEVKMCKDFALYQTICKLNALADWAHARGWGVFLGNESATVGDFVNRDVPRDLRAAVVTASKKASGMSTEDWRTIRRRSTRRHGRTPDCLQSVVLDERLVVTQAPFTVRRATPTEAKEIDAFVRRFERAAPVLPLSWPAPPEGRRAGLGRSRLGP